MRWVGLNKGSAGLPKILWQKSSDSERKQGISRKRKGPEIHLVRPALVAPPQAAMFCFSFFISFSSSSFRKTKTKRITWNEIASKSVNASHDDHRNGRQTPPQHQKDVLSVFWDCDFRDNNLEKKRNKMKINK